MQKKQIIAMNFDRHSIRIFGLTILFVVAIYQFCFCLEDKRNYIFPHSRFMNIDEDGLSLPELKIARNEIYAKHGFIFKVESIQAFFKKKRWYRENHSFSEQEFNDIEITNIERLYTLENATEKYSPDSIIFTIPFMSGQIVYTYSNRQDFPHYYNYCLYITSKPFQLNTLENIAIYKAIFTDASSPLSASQIRVLDINRNYPQNIGPEILINLNGPSEDYSQICLGFDETGQKIIRYYHIGGFVTDFQTIDKLNTLIKTVIRIHYYARYHELLFN